MPFSFVAFFDDATETAIKRNQELLVASDFAACELPIGGRPHVSLMSSNIFNGDMKARLELLARKQHRPINVDFLPVDYVEIGQAVCFMPVYKTPELALLQENIKTCLLAEGQPEDIRYQEKYWQPHCTLTHSAWLSKLHRWQRVLSLPTKGCVTALGVIEYPNDQVIFELQLKAAVEDQLKTA